jgi:hypothetical protein
MKVLHFFYIAFEGIAFVGYALQCDPIFMHQVKHMLIMVVFCMFF